MKFFGNSKDEKNKKTVLFVCVQNAGRSQIAEAFFRKYAPYNYEAISAGTEPAGNLNPLAMIENELASHRQDKTRVENGIGSLYNKIKDITPLLDIAIQIANWFKPA